MRVPNKLLLPTLPILLLCLTMTSVQSYAAEPEKAAPLNVLFISIDDLNDWIGCMNGHPQALTPNMDRLAARGMLFANAHCAAPACNPSRAAVFSGRMPQTTKIWGNGSGSLQKHNPGMLFLPVAFDKANYRTLGTGKLLHSKSGSLFDDYFDTQQRWSPFTGRVAVEYTDAEQASKATDNPRHVMKDPLGRELVLPLNRMPSDRRPDTKDGESFDWGPIDVPDGEYGDTRITDWAAEELNKKRKKSFFLAVGYYRPHIPLFAPARFFERFKKQPAELPPFKADDLDDLGETGKRYALEAVTAGSHKTVVEHQQWRAAVEAYLACTTYVDEEIGRLIDTLDASAHADNTWIVLWSDHGWHLGEKQHWGKVTGWERSTRVPLIMVPPKRDAAAFAKAGSVCEQPVSLLDLYPTLIEACGVKGPEKLDGHSLLPLLRDPKAAFRPATVTLIKRDASSLRDRDWRYIRYDDDSEELYDLNTDPNEWHNHASVPEHAKRLASLKKKLDALLAEFEATAN